MIISYIDKDHRTWDQHLAEFRFAYNTACHSSLGTSPAFLNFGRDPLPINSLRKRATGKPEVELRQPDQWFERMVKIQAMRDWVIKNLDNAFKRQSKYYNLRRRPVRFNTGQLVLAKGRAPSSKTMGVAAKLYPKFV